MLPALSFLSVNRVLRENRSPFPGSSSLYANRDDQRFLFERKLSAEIEATLVTVSGILEARVHLNLPPIDPLFGKEIGGRQGSASVLLVIQPEAAVERDAIAALVAGAAGIASVSRARR